MNAQSCLAEVGLLQVASVVVPTGWRREQGHQALAAKPVTVYNSSRSIRLLIDHLDHLVLTTAHEAESIRFYTEVLGMHLETFVGGAPPVERKAFKFVNQKINLHVKGREFEPKAQTPVPGALDLCFIAAVPLDTVPLG